MPTEPQAQRPCTDALGVEVAAYFRQRGREQAVWTPAALEDLKRVVDSVPAETQRADKVA